MASVGRIFWRSNRSKKRHTPTRMPYSCQLQFGTSGSIVTPVGGASTWRAIGFPMSQTSRLTMVQNTTRAPPGSFNGGRSEIAEKSARSRGSIGLARARFLTDFFMPRPYLPIRATRTAQRGGSWQDNRQIQNACQIHGQSYVGGSPSDNLRQLLRGFAPCRWGDHNHVKR